MFFFIYFFSDPVALIDLFLFFIFSSSVDAMRRGTGLIYFDGFGPRYRASDRDKRQSATVWALISRRLGELGCWEEFCGSVDEGTRPTSISGYLIIFVLSRFYSRNRRNHIKFWTNVYTFSRYSSCSFIRYNKSLIEHWHQVLRGGQINTFDNDKVHITDKIVAWNWKNLIKRAIQFNM